MYQMYLRKEVAVRDGRGDDVVLGVPSYRLVVVGRWVQEHVFLSCSKLVLRTSVRLQFNTEVVGRGTLEEDLRSLLNGGWEI